MVGAFLWARYPFSTAPSLTFWFFFFGIGPPQEQQTRLMNPDARVAGVGYLPPELGTCPYLRLERGGLVLTSHPSSDTDAELQGYLARKKLPPLLGPP